MRLEALTKIVTLAANLKREDKTAITPSDVMPWLGGNEPPTLEEAMKSWR